MSPIHISPGVYSREIDLSNYPSGVSSSIIAMVGTATKGPINVPTLVTSPSQAVAEFGNPTPSSYLMYSVLNALENANQVYIVRVGTKEGTDALAKASKAIVTGSAASTNAVVAEPYVITDDNKTMKVKVDGGGVQTVVLQTGSKTAAQVASRINQRIKGAVATVDGSDRVVITSLGIGANSALEFVSVDFALFELVNVTQAYVTGTQTETFNIVTGSNDKVALAVNNQGTVEVTLSANAVATAADIAAEIEAAVPGVVAVDDGSGKVQISTELAGSNTSLEVVAVANDAYTDLGLTVGEVSGTSAVPAGVDTADEIFDIEALNEGSWGNDISVQIENLKNDKLKIVVFDGANLAEQFSNMTYGLANVDDDNYVEKIINGTDATFGSEYITITEDTSISGKPKTIAYGQSAGQLVGGADGILGVEDADYIGVAFDEDTKGATGLQTLADPERIDINLIAVPGNSSSAVIREMLSLCEGRADAMCVVDPPMGLTSTEVTDWHNGQGFGNDSAFNSSYGALYWSWMEYYDSFNKQNIFLPPSGFALSQYALTDLITEPWFAPAGLTRGRVLQALDVEHSPNLGERDLLYGNGNAVNPIVNFTKDGIVIWGQRTLQRTATALDRVNVRRLLLYLRKVASNASRAFVFEPSDPITWRRMQELFDGLLSDVQARRGIREYKVTCDETNNTPVRVDRGELWVTIHLIPTKSSEIIQLDFVILAQGASVEESLV